ncbi:MAG: lipopolysaccharide assembly protein LapA domain-containing protein [Pseudomonadota bacterium]
MFRALRLLVVLLIAIVLVLIAVANRDPVPLQVMPDALAGIFQIEFQVPLFVLMIVLGGGGFALGFSWEYLREWRIRAEARRNRRTAEKLEREVKDLRAQSGEVEDDVLALLK